MVKADAVGVVDHIVAFFEFFQGAEEGSLGLGDTCFFSGPLYPIVVCDKLKIEKGVFKTRAQGPG